MALADQLTDVEHVGPGWSSSHSLRSDIHELRANFRHVPDCDFGPSLGVNHSFAGSHMLPYLDCMVLALPRHGLGRCFGGKAIERIRLLSC